MVRITAEKGDECRAIEGKASIVYILEPAEGGDHASIAMADGIKPVELLMGAVQALGSLAAEFYKNPFERMAVLSLMAKEIIDSPENFKVFKKEGTVKVSDDED